VTLVDRFWSKVDRSGGPDACWPWMAKASHEFGYGIFAVGSRLIPGSRRRLGAHRVAYELTFGPIPGGQLVRHEKCGRPRCCNPLHLSLGTELQNSADMIRMGRSLTGERNPRAKLNAEQVASIRARMANGEHYRTLAAEYAITPNYVHRIARRAAWAHAPRPIDPTALANAILDAAESRP